MYVITSRYGEDYGAATVTWVSQASFRPPLIMAAIRPGSNVFKCLSRRMKNMEDEPEMVSGEALVRCS